MAEEDTKTAKGVVMQEKPQVQKEPLNSLAKNEKRFRKSSLKKTTTAEEKLAAAQTPAQQEAAKESQMLETFHDANQDKPSDLPPNIHIDAGGSNKEMNGNGTDQHLNRSSTSLSGENARSEEEQKPSKKEDLFPGDELIPDAAMVYDQKRTIKAPAEDIFPWLLQLGKNRGGWYMPSRLEAILPLTWRPSRTIESKWQRLTPGERVADYGFGRNDYFVVDRVDEPHSIVFRSKRYGCECTWALLLRELHDRASDPEPATVVHLRFRGKTKAEGFKRRVVVKGGQVLDKLSTMPLLVGLAERCEQPGQLEQTEKPSRWSYSGMKRLSRAAPEESPRNSVA